MNEFHVPLAAAIEALRGELLAALKAGEGKEVRFALGPVELEFQVEVSRDVGADGAVKFWVVAMGAKGSPSSSATHTVRLSLSPVLASDVGSDVPLVVGSEQVRRPR